MILITQITKSVKSEIAEIEKLIAKSEAAFRNAFSEYLTTIKSAAQLKIIRQYLERNDIEGLIKHFNSLKKPFGKVLADAMLAAGTYEAATLQPKIQRAINARIPVGTPKPAIGIEFQIANPRAAELLRNQTETLIREINEQQSKTIYNILETAQLEGGHPRGLKGLADEIHSNIGLTKKQSQAVRNYERLLRQGSKEALSRELRDRRLDGKIKRGEPLSDEQIDRMVNAYRKRYEKYRADAIARTESKSAVETARYEASLQSAEQSGISPDEIVDTWRTSIDGRQRDTHGAMNGQKRTGDEPFVSPSGAKFRFPADRSLGAGASEIIHCRCVTTREVVLRD